MKRLFILDDDTDISESLAIWFKKKGFLVTVFSLSESLLDALENTAPNLILMDVNLENTDGREFCKELKLNHNLDCPIVLFSANSLVLKDYKAYLADGAIEKPFSLKEITNIVTEYMQIQ